MKKVLLFPGAFSPPHLGHVAAIRAAVAKVPFDELWIVPSGRRDNKVISIRYEDREALGALFTQYLETVLSIPVKVLLDELRDPEDRPSQEVLKEIKSRPGIQFAHLIGLDAFTYLQGKLGADLNGENYIIAKRTGYELPDNFVLNDNLLVVDPEAPDISSTKIREMVQRGNSAYKELVPKEIALYIESKNLYR